MAGIPLLKHLRDRGVRSGLNQTTNSFRMAAYIVAPLLILWVVVKAFVPAEWGDTASGLIFAGWIAYIVLLYARAKSEAAGYIPFPQSHWFFPDGQQISYDLLVPPNGWEKLITYKDGSTLYRVHTKDKQLYQEADRPFPDIFNRMLWKLPADWNDTFKRNGHGEFFFENLFIDHPACENIEVSVIEWEERGGSRFPVCVVTGCSYFFEVAKKALGKKFPDKKYLKVKGRQAALIADYKEEIRELRTRNQHLEMEAEQYTKKEPRSIKDLSDKRLSRIREEVGDIMDTERSWKDWLFINGKYIGYALVGIGIFFLITHFIFGWP